MNRVGVGSEEGFQRAEVRNLFITFAEFKNIDVDNVTWFSREDANFAKKCAKELCTLVTNS